MKNKKNEKRRERKVEPEGGGRKKIKVTHQMIATKLRMNLKFELQ